MDLIQELWYSTPVHVTIKILCIYYTVPEQAALSQFTELL